MKYKIITIGEVKKSFAKEGVTEYLKRLGGFESFEYVVVKDDNKAYKKITKQTEKSFVVAMDEHGKEYTSKGLALFLGEKEQESTQEIVFVIGAADGHPESFLSNTHAKISLSKLTMPHELALLFLTETLYRAISINKNHPYHRE